MFKKIHENDWYSKIPESILHNSCTYYDFWAFRVKLQLFSVYFWKPNQPTGSDPSLTNSQNQSNEVPIYQSINWNQSLIIDPNNLFCDEAGECGGIVEVVFESNNTIVLESYNSYHIFKVADIIKNLSGFQIVDVSTTPQEDSTKYLVVLSK